MLPEQIDKASSILQPEFLPGVKSRWSVQETKISSNTECGGINVPYMFLKLWELSPAVMGRIGRLKV
jgi:hypothetical protein